MVKEKQKHRRICGQGRRSRIVGVIPYPKSVEVSGSQELARGLRLDHPVDGLVRRLFPAERIAEDNGLRIEGSLSNRVHAEEGYHLLFAPDRVMVRALTYRGYATAQITLAHMLRAARRYPHRFTFPTAGIIVDDEPRFLFRGLLLDVARQVFTVEEILHVIDCMAWSKLNRLHLHLTDNEGWRLDIPKYPQLAERAVLRGEGLLLPPSLGSGPEPYGNIFSGLDIKLMQNRADALGVTIIPEIEMPGHSYAILQAMPELRDPGDRPGACNLNPALPQTYEVVENILGYVADVFDSHYVHLGSDEVPVDAWDRSPAARALMVRKGFVETRQLKSYFLKRVQGFMHGLQRGVGVWEEAAKDGGLEPHDAYVCAWLSYGEELARDGYNVVSTPNNRYYLDMKPYPGMPFGMDQVVTPEMTYAFDPNGEWPADIRHQLMGTMGSMWGEFLHERSRMETFMNPRASAIAETAWSPAAAKDFRRFSKLADLLPEWVQTPVSAHSRASCLI